MATRADSSPPFSPPLPPPRPRRFAGSRAASTSTATSSSRPAQTPARSSSSSPERHDALQDNFRCVRAKCTSGSAHCVAVRPSQPRQQDGVLTVPAHVLDLAGQLRLKVQKSYLAADHGWHSTQSCRRPFLRLTKASAIMTESRSSELQITARADKGQGRERRSARPAGAVGAQTPHLL
eukprot:2484584-Rhodomonas_salina.1